MRCDEAEKEILLHSNQSANENELDITGLDNKQRPSRGNIDSIQRVSVSEIKSADYSIFIAVKLNNARRLGIDWTENERREDDKFINEKHVCVFSKIVQNVYFL